MFETRTYEDAHEFEADFALGGEVEFEEEDGGQTSLEMEQLVARVQAARSCGA